MKTRQARKVTEIHPFDPDRSRRRAPAGPALRGMREDAGRTEPHNALPPVLLGDRGETNRLLRGTQHGELLLMKIANEQLELAKTLHEAILELLQPDPLSRGEFSEVAGAALCRQLAMGNKDAMFTEEEFDVLYNWALKVRKDWLRLSMLMMGVGNVVIVNGEVVVK